MNYDVNDTGILSDVLMRLHVHKLFVINLKLEDHLMQNLLENQNK